MKKRHGMDSIQAPIQILHGRHPLGMLYATEQKKNYIGGPGAPSPPVSGIRGKACISAKSRRILEKFHSMHPLGMLHALEQKKNKMGGPGPPSPADPGTRGNTCISLKSRRILKKYHRMHPLG